MRLVAAIDGSGPAGLTLLRPSQRHEAISDFSLIEYTKVINQHISHN